MSDLNSEANISFHTAKYEEVKSWYDDLPEDILAWLEENGQSPNPPSGKSKRVSGSIPMETPRRKPVLRFNTSRWPSITAYI